MSELKEKVTETTPTRVRVGLGATLQVTQYEPIRIDIAVEDSARPGEKVNDVFNRLYAFVEGKLVEKAREVDHDFKK